jgi:DNA-directed RNA polymerase sigma subunit (sigma70/sigma32)
VARLGLPSGHHHIGRDELPTRPRAPDLGRRSKAGGEEARRVLPEGKLLCVVSTAKSYRGPRLSIEHLTREGGIDLMKAVDEFDPDKGDRLCIRATWWIGQSVGRKPTGREEG